MALEPAAVLAVGAGSLGVLLIGAGGTRRPAPRPGRRSLAVVGGVVGGVALVRSPASAVLILLALGVVFGAVRLLRAQRLAVAAQQVRLRVVEVCEALHGELVAGQATDAALARVAEQWPPLGPVARVAATGGDVPAALRSLAAARGAEALRIVAAAWQVAHRTGHGLADSLARVADDLRAVEQTRRVVAGELASARATARLLAVLPVLALVLGTGAGADPWHFLLATPAGLACLGAGLGFGYAGLAWIEALARDVESRS